MRKSFKYRIYPTSVQRESLDGMFEFCRLLYNSALQERISHYKQFHKGISYNSQSAQLPGIKKQWAEETGELYSQSMQSVLKQVDGAYGNFFRRVKSKADKAGFPRFKQFGRFKSILFPQSDGNSGGVYLLSDKKVKIFGLGEMKIVLHRPLRGRCKTVQIKKDGNRYFLIFSCDDVPANLLEKTGKTAAFDLGLTHLLVEDNGTEYSHPRPARTAKDKLAEKQRKLARKQKNSKNRERAVSELQKAHQKVRNIRQDFQHKLANRLIAENDVLIFEKLAVKQLLEKEPKPGQRNLSYGIQDASWSSFLLLIIYKAECAGREIRFVDPRNTSKMCSGCYMIKADLTLGDREYCCSGCGLKIGRDHNAAKNIKRIGMILTDSKPLSLEASSFRTR